MTCPPIEAITHNDDNVVVDADKCNFLGMDCIPGLPHRLDRRMARVVTTPYSLEAQFGWTELPEQGGYRRGRRCGRRTRGTRRCRKLL